MLSITYLKLIRNYGDRSGCTASRLVPLAASIALTDQARLGLSLGLLARSDGGRYVCMDTDRIHVKRYAMGGSR